MANPRKFSEKIALHHQKQAEETAAFDAIMKEVGSLPKKPPGGPVDGLHQHLHIHPEANSHLGTYRGGSLPNVNAIDLQSALHSLEDMKQQPNTSRQTLVERLTRDRARHMPVRRQMGLDKRVPAMECSPYGSPFLSPPLDTNWRRTNSDSALHTSAMGPISHSILQNTPPTNRRVLEQTSSMDSQVGLAGGGTNSQLLDPKRMIQSRPRSCEMPRIENNLPPGWLRTDQSSIYPSPEQDSGLPSHLPISSNTGSLPDLTTLHFPPPLTTPLDTDEGGYPTSPSSLSPSPVMHLQTQQASPGPRRRPPHGTPSPLVLHGSPTQMRHNVCLQGSSLEGARVSSEGRLHQQFHPYHIHPPHHHPQPHQHTQQQQPTNPASSPSPEHQRLHSTINSLSPSQSAGLTYRNGVVECPASPSSPLSQQSYSPSQSPSNLSPSVVSGSPFSDPYYPPQSPQQQQQQQQQQANALQHRFEQFNMLQENHPKTSNSALCSMVSGLQSMPFTQQLASSPDFTTLGQFAFPPGAQSPGSLSPQPHSPLTSQSLSSPSGHMTSSEQMVPVSSHQQTNNNIPDIILTDPLSLLAGVDDMSRQDFAKELCSAMAMAESLSDSDFFPTDEVLKVGLDPLDLDGLQMLTESSLITDPDVEESFRQDRC